MESYYQQESPERCVKAMKKSGKLAIALIGVAVGVILLLLGNRIGKGTGDASTDTSSGRAVTRTTEEYRADLVCRVWEL